MIQSAGVAQIVAGAVAPPQRRRDRAAVDALAALAERELHAAVVLRLEAARIVRSPGAHHHVLRVELRRQRMRREVVRLPAILGGHGGGRVAKRRAVARILCVLELTRGRHVHRRAGRRVLVVVMVVGHVADAGRHLWVGGR